MVRVGGARATVAVVIIVSAAVIVEVKMTEIRERQQ